MEQKEQIFRVLFHFFQNSEQELLAHREMAVSVFLFPKSWESVSLVEGGTICSTRLNPHPARNPQEMLQLPPHCCLRPKRLLTASGGTSTMKWVSPEPIY